MIAPRTIRKWVLGAILVLVLSPLLGTVYTYTRAGESARVYAATASTLNFQARLLNTSGALVNDGSYSVEFKLYDAISGGTNEWTGTYSVTVKNGYLSAYLGSGATPFSGSIDWSGEKWLTMNVNGDGEMTPRIKLTAVPYAFRSGQADSLTITGGSITGDNLLHKAPGSVQSLSSANAGLRFNQTGAGGLIQLQGDGANVFTVDKTGNAALGGGLRIGGSSSTTAGTLRWTGTDFEGYNGSGWVSLTATGGTTPFVHGGNDFNADAVLGTTDNDALRFITSNTEKLTILGNGNIGVGDTTPLSLFTVGTNDALQINASGNLSTTGTITSGAINGQDIDATANLTGTLGVAGLTTLSGGLTLEAGDTLTFNGEGFTDLTGTGLTNNGGVLGLANTSVSAGSYGNQSTIPTFTVDAQGRLTAAGTVAVGNLANSALQNSSFGVSYGTNLSGDASVALGGTLNVNFSSTPTFTSVTTGTVTNAGALNLTATGAGNDIVMNGADRVDITAGSTIELLSNTNLTGNLDISGTLNIGTNNALKIDANGSLTTTFRALDGVATATSGSGGLGSGTINVGAGNTTNFDIGNYVLVNGTYAKITAKTASSLTITPNLTWANGATVTEYYIPEIGGTNTGSTLTNRFGRGYFIAGVATGNGTTFYNEDGITTTLDTFNIANENVTTLNIGASATTLNIGNASSTLNILGSLEISANETITAGGGLIVNANGIDLNSTGIFEAGAISGVTTISASGGITAATSNTINGLSINSGSLSGITGITFSSGGLNLNSGGITNAGSIGGITGLTFISGGLNLGGGGITNAGAIGGVTGLTFISGNLVLGGGNVTGVGALTATTVNVGAVTNAGILNLSATGAGNDVILTAADQIQLNAGTTIELQDNTNITGTLNLTGGISNTLSVKFNTGGANPAHMEGLLFYDNTQKALSYYNSEADVTLNLGQENFIYVYNNTGATITDGQVVYINGVNAGVPTVALARSDAEATAHAAGVATHAIETGTFGFITAFGEINNLNTNAFNAGDSLYLSPTTAGALTNVRPTQPNFTTLIGKVTEKSITTGKIVVNTGGFNYGAYTAGAIAFGGSDGNVKQDATNFFWDDTNNRLGIGDATPLATLTVGSGDLFQVAGATGNVSTSGTLTITGLTTLNGGLTLEAGDTFTIGGQGFTDLTGNGLTLSGTALTIDATTAGTVAGTGSNSGLVVAADGVSLLRGCANNQILKWSTTGPQWNCAADATGVSDARLKKNIEAVDMDVLSRIRGINLYSFDYDCSHEAFQRMHCDTDHQAAGVMAQELQQLFPELVTEVNGFYQVHYDKLGLYNLKALGELADEVDALATNNTQLTEVVTNGVLRMDSNGALRNINGLTMSSGGASIVGGLNNNNSGITAAGAIVGVTNLGAQSISLNAAGDQNLLTLTKDGNGVFTVFNSGALELKLDSEHAFRVRAANGDNALNVDTLTGKVKIGSGNNGKTVLFVLDTKSSDGDPAGVNGAQYYNSKMKKFRCYQNDRWQDCLQTAFSEYTIASGGMPWQQPMGDHELPGENRTWIDFSNANQARLLVNVSSSGASGASCRLQYSLTEDNPDWKDLTDTGNTGIGRTGAVKGEWLQIKDEAKKEVLVRVYCSGGDNQANFQYSSVRTQVR